MKNGEQVAAFEREFAAFVRARYAIALVNGTATLHAALVALGVKPGDRVAVPPLTMSATTIAVLHAGAVPVFVDVDQDTWLMGPTGDWGGEVSVPVSLYGLGQPYGSSVNQRGMVSRVLDDAAQTLRKHDSGACFTSYSFQASKILPLGEGGMLCTNDEGLATKAREFSSLGYRMRADQPRIDPAVLKSPTYERHHSLGWNYRMNDITASLGLQQLGQADGLKETRRWAAKCYRDAIAGCSWLTPQHVPDGWQHDYWTFAVAYNDQLAHGDRSWFGVLAAMIEQYGGERPYACWQITYQEPAFRHLAPDGTCPVSEDLQPRLLQFHTNDLASAERNASALHKAIKELGG